MDIDNIETADCNVLHSIKLKNNIWIKFSCLYLVNEGRYCGEMVLLLVNVSCIKICKYNNDGGEVETVPTACKYYNFGIELVQYIKFENGLLILGCFLKRGEWLEVSCQSEGIVVGNTDEFIKYK